METIPESSGKEIAGLETSAALPKTQLKLKTIHEQVRQTKPSASTLKSKLAEEDPEIIDTKILEMINKNNDLLYDDDYEYFQYFGKKKLDESSWRLLSKEDDEK